MSIINRNFIILLLFLYIGEISIRLLGLVDFPIYDANSTIGYIPSANQHGSFLNKNNWEFNALHMGAPEFAPTSDTDILLVGDSIVLGGNPLGQSERLGPQLEQTTTAKIWPISAGSWALRNELAYLRTNPDVIKQIDSIIVVLNSGDFGEASSWKCDLTHPRHKPALALWYLFNKYVYSFEACNEVPAGLQVPPGDVWNELSTFLQSTQLKPIFIIYPDKDEITNVALRNQHFVPNIDRLLSMSDTSHIIKIADDKRWNNNLYRDGIHPSAEGNVVLARIIADAIKLIE